ncbi:hypothetical protein GCM10010508_05830 [Streptomyces naganishii JCM 4654]|uniref:Uncharacterized protein n=1 Tax=Streptomyces naganishii JCM 4654 TaxID=1306179 RepID=A0A919CT44_9ACTN|nr:hypothetical protein GCM10010508_05830 [Streptomyces naganishii JCM 4654]
MGIAERTAREAEFGVLEGSTAARLDSSGAATRGDAVRLAGVRRS